MLRASTLAWALVLLAACDGSGPVGRSAEALHEAPAWIGEARAIATRAELSLVRGEPASGPEASDVRMPVPLAVIDGAGEVRLPPVPSVDAALWSRGVAWVAVTGELLVDDGLQARVLDRGVVGELAVDPSGDALAYVIGPGDRAGVWIVSGDAPPRRASVGLDVADRPLFVDDRRLIVVGARPGGIAGVWVIAYRGSAQPVPVTNETLRVGAPLGPSFVPPPAYHESMRIDGDELVYDDGEQVRRVSIAAALARSAT